MHIKCDVIVDAWLDAGCDVGIVLFTQTMPAIKLYIVQVCVSNKITIPRVVGCVTNEYIILVFQ